MGRASLVIVGALLASCAATPEEGQRTAAEQHAYASLVAGKAAGAPVTCVPNYNMYDLQIIDSQTVAYRLGSRATYIVQLSPGCGRLSQGQSALVTHQLGTDLCRGDFAEVLDPASRSAVGSCHVVQILPYSRNREPPG